MKKYGFLLVMLCLSLQFSSAQLQRHDINLSIGGFSSNFFDAVSYDILTDQRLAGPVSKKIGEQTGAIFVTYRFFPNNNLSIGITGGIERVKGIIQINAEDSGVYYNDYFSGALEFDYRYISRGRIQLYSGGGVGIMFNEEKNDIYTYQENSEEFNFAYQVNLIGFRYGGIFGVFIEAGYGYKGILKLGFNIQL